MASPVSEPPAQYSSPKRKRDVTNAPSSTPTRLNTNLTFPPPTFAEASQLVEGSPRTAVARDLEHLKLQGHGRGKIDFRLAIRNGTETSGVVGMVEETMPVGEAPTKRIKTLDNGPMVGDVIKVQERNDSVDAALEPKSNETCEEHKASGSASPSMAVRSDAGRKDTKKHTKSTKKFKAPTKAVTVHPKAKTVTPRTRLKSPPMPGNRIDEGAPANLSNTNGDSTEEGDEGNFRLKLTWRDDEITGMDLDDPDDDGEGVNGIGYRPTAAQAYSRIEKRKQQIMEYRSREASEARARRMAKRTKIVTPVPEDGEDRGVGARKVRFADGIEA